jgi:hypothetical protein
MRDLASHLTKRLENGFTGISVVKVFRSLIDLHRARAQQNGARTRNRKGS